MREGYGGAGGVCGEESAEVGSDVEAELEGEGWVVRRLDGSLEEWEERCRCDKTWCILGFGSSFFGRESQADLSMPVRRFLWVFPPRVAAAILYFHVREKL